MAFFQDVLHEDIRSTGRQRNSCTTYGQDHWRVGLVSLAGASGLCPSLARRACVPRWRVGLVSLAGASGLCPSLARRACVPRWRVGLVSLASASGLCPSLARRACVPRWRVGLVSSFRVQDIWRPTNGLRTQSKRRTGAAVDRYRIDRRAGVAAVPAGAAALGAE